MILDKLLLSVIVNTMQEHNSLMVLIRVQLRKAQSVWVTLNINVNNILLTSINYKVITT